MGYPFEDDAEMSFCPDFYSLGYEPFHMVYEKGPSPFSLSFPQWGKQKVHTLSEILEST